MIHILVKMNDQALLFPIQNVEVTGTYGKTILHKEKDGAHIVIMDSYKLLLDLRSSLNHVDEYH